MTKAELVERLATETGLTQKATGKFLNAAFGAIGGAVRKHGRFTYPGFGTWDLRTRAERKIRNPQSGEIMTLRATTTIGFRPSKEVKQALEARQK